MVNFPLEALPCAFNQHGFPLKNPYFQEATKQRPTGKRKGYLSYFRAWVSTREAVSPREMLCLKEKEKKLNKTKTPHKSLLFPFCHAKLQFRFCNSWVTKWPDCKLFHTRIHTLFWSVCLPLCCTGIKNYYFAEREECQWLNARWIQNLLTGGAHLKNKHPVIVNARIAFFFLKPALGICGRNLWVLWCRLTTQSFAS